MGMYTELIFNAELKEDTPENVINILNYICKHRLEEVIGKHELFETSSWRNMLLSDSSYFTMITRADFRFDKFPELTP